MQRSKRLTPIKELAQNNEKNAAHALASALEKQKRESDKLEQLFQYRIEYLQQMEVQIKKGINGTKLQQYHLFLSKLDSAISHQKNVFESCVKQLDRTKNNWQQKHCKTEAISQVMNKMAVKEQNVLDKREAKQNDEISTQAFIRRQNTLQHH